MDKKIIQIKKCGLFTLEGYTHFDVSFYEDGDRKTKTFYSTASTFLEFTNDLYDCFDHMLFNCVYNVTDRELTRLKRVHGFVLECDDRLFSLTPEDRRRLEATYYVTLDRQQRELKSIVDDFFE